MKKLHLSYKQLSNLYLQGKALTDLLKEEEFDLEKPVTFNVDDAGQQVIYTQP